MTTPERIRKRREQLSLSIREVADQLGVSPSTVLRYETNAIRKMGIDKLDPLARVLKTTPEYLAGWVDENGEETASMRLAKIMSADRIRESKMTDTKRMLVDFIADLDDSQAESLLVLIKGILNK